MLFHVPDLIYQHDAFGETPLSVDTFEAILVATSNDRLEGQLGSRLLHDEVGARCSTVVLLLDVDSNIRGQMAGPERAVFCLLYTSPSPRDRG